MTWIYLLVMVGLVAFWYNNGGTDKSNITSETKYSDFKVMVQKGYAKEIVVNKYQGTLQMYVLPDHIYDVFRQHVEQTGKNPSVTVAIGSLDQVEEFINQQRAEGHFKGKFSYDNSKEGEFFNSLLMNLLFFGGIILIWMFIMRLQRRQVEGTNVREGWRLRHHLQRRGRSSWRQAGDAGNC